MPAARRAAFPPRALARLGVLLTALSLCLSLSAGATPPPESGIPLARIFTPREYQADPLCQAVVQGPDGVVVIANNTLAIAYDGVDWQTIPLPAESTGIVQLSVGPDGLVYAAGGNVIGYFDGPAGRKFYRSLRDWLPAEEQEGSREYRIAAGRDGIYFSDGGKTLRVRRGATLAAVRGSCPSNAELFAAGGEVYVKGDDASLYRVVNDTLVAVVSDPSLREAEPVLIEAESNGELRVWTRRQELLRLSADHRITRTALLDRRWAGKRVHRVLRLRDGFYAVAFTPGTGGGGVLLASDGRFAGRLDESIGLPNHNVRSLAADREGGLWVGLEYGIARLEWPASVTVFNATSGLDGFVTSIARHRGELYAATLSGLHKLAAPTSPTAPPRFERILNEAVYGLWPDEGGLLFRTQTELGRVTATGHEILLPLPSAIGAIEASVRDPHRLWLNTMQGLRSVYRTENGWRDEGAIPGFNEHVAGLVEREDGTMWISSFERGLFLLRFRDPAHPQAGVADVQRFTSGHGLPDFDHCAVYGWKGEPVFLFAGNARPYVFASLRQEFSPMPGSEQLPADIAPNCWSSHPSGESFWFTTNEPRSARQRIYRWPGDSGKPQFLPHAIADTAGKIWQMREETTAGSRILWICAVNGLLRVELDRAFRPGAPLRVLLRADGVTAGATLPADRTTPRFAFVAPRFQPGAAVRYQSRLIGAETEWSGWSPEQTRSYGRLSGGDYRFEVRACDADGNTSPIAAVSFSLFPPWWKSTWALALAGLAALLAVIALTRWIALRALKRRLELLKAQSAVEHERLRLARDLHDDIGSGLGRVILFASEAERAADPAQLTAALGRMRDTAQELVQHAREIVWAVSPQHDSVASLAERVGDYAMETITAAGMRCETDIPYDLPAWPLRSDARHSLFLAVKEALHNCIKYSAAKKVVVSARVHERCFTLTIADNGRGFAPGERRGSGHGLRNLASRAEALGGTAEITSIPGEGTTVTLRVPVAPPPAA